MTETEAHPLARPSTYDPFAQLDRWFDDLAGRFDEAFGLSAAPGPFAGPLRAARADVKDLGASYQVVAELPGIPKEKLEIRIRGDEVELRAEIDEDVPADPPRYLYRERRHRGFLRSLTLPEPVVAAKAQATLKDGVLTLDLPKQHPEPVPAEVKVPVQ